MSWITTSTAQRKEGLLRLPSNPSPFPVVVRQPKAAAPRRLLPLHRHHELIALGVHAHGEVQRILLGVVRFGREIAAHSTYFTFSTFMAATFN